MVRKRNNEYMRQYVAARYLTLKLKAIEYKGGKCQDCGYNKCYAALEFHHRDPTKKDFNWGSLRKRAWNNQIFELDKCDLVCANCHRERHHNVVAMIKTFEFINSRKQRLLSTIICKTCNKKFKPQNGAKVYCSRKCTSISQQKIDWPINLVELVANSSKRVVAMTLGVSDKAVAKRLKNHHQI